MSHRTVFILGAGASAEGGAPLMREFLDVADEIGHMPEIVPSGSQLHEQFTLVFKARAELQYVFAKSTLELQNIESLFAAFEMAELFGRLGKLTGAEVERLTGAIKSVIVTTLEARLHFPVQEGQVHPPRPYAAFAALVRDFSRPQPTNVTVMTFNYDLGVDYAFNFNSIPFTYGINSKDSTPSVTLLKLHGSLNWTRCPNRDCNAVKDVDLRRWLLTKRTPHHATHFNFAVSKDLPQQCGTCGKVSEREPLIVPPTWNKTQHYTEIRNVWSLAAEHLAEAENIVVIGYSLPTTDQFFHYLYALGSGSPVWLKHFLIINTDPNIVQRFSTLLGPLAKERLKVETCTFSEGIARVKQLLKT